VFSKKQAGTLKKFPSQLICKKTIGAYTDLIKKFFIS
jgi:hypothetical protein